MLDRKQLITANHWLGEYDSLQRRLKEWESVSPKRVTVTAKSPETDDPRTDDVFAMMELPEQLGASMIEMATAEIKKRIAEVAAELKKLEVDPTAG